MSSSEGYVDEVPPSLDLVALLLGLHHDPDLEFEGRIAAVAGWERIIAWATALQAEQLVAIDQGAEAAEYGWDDTATTRSLTEVLGLALGVSGGLAVHRVNTAETLIQKTPAVHDALKRGAVTVHHARIVASAAATLPAGVAQAAAAATMTDDAWRTPMQCGATFAHHVITLDPDGAADRHRTARRRRRVSRRNEPDGMGSLWALLPAEDSQAVYDHLDACARSSLATNTTGDTTSLDERRADALVHLILGHHPGRTDGAPPTPPNTPTGPNTAPTTAAPPNTPTRHGRRPAVQVTVAWSTLIGTDDHPAHLTGYGPIDAHTARRIAADPTSTWYRLLTDPASGTLLDHGRTRYRPPQDLRDFVMARDRCCRFPGCERTAAACDLDHRTDWLHGGTTCPDCLDCLCRRHHQLKHQGGWTHRRDPDTGDSTWTDPRGHQHHRPATTLPTPTPVEPPPPAVDPGTTSGAEPEPAPAMSGARSSASTADDPPF